MSSKNTGKVTRKRARSHSLDSQKLIDFKLKRILAELPLSPDKTHLDLSNNNFAALGVRKIAAYLREYTTPTSLDISGNDVNGNITPLLDNGAEITAAFLTADARFITSLDISGNAIDGNIAPLLDDACGLNEIDAHNNYFDYLGVLQIYEPLKVNTSVRVLRLSVDPNEKTSHRINDEGADLLIEALFENSSLFEIDLEGHDISEAKMAVIQALVRANQIRYLLTNHATVSAIQDVEASFSLNDSLAFAYCIAKLSKTEVDRHEHKILHLIGRMGPGALEAVIQALHKLAEQGVSFVLARLYEDSLFGLTPEHAVEVYKCIPVSSEHYPDAVMKLGRYYFDKGRYQEAVPYLLAAHSRAVPDAEQLRDRAIAGAERRNLRDFVMQEYPVNNPFKQGLLFFAEGNYVAALGCFARAESYDPAQALCYKDMAQHHHFVQLKEMTEFRDDNANYRLAEYYRTGLTGFPENADEAYKCYGKVSSQSEKYGEARFQLAVHCENERNAERARKFYMDAYAGGHADAEEGFKRALVTERGLQREDVDDELLKYYMVRHFAEEMGLRLPAHDFPGNVPFSKSHTYQAFLNYALETPQMQGQKAQRLFLLGALLFADKRYEEALPFLTAAKEENMPVERYVRWAQASAKTASLNKYAHAKVYSELFQLGLNLEGVDHTVPFAESRFFQQTIAFAQMTWSFTSEVLNKKTLVTGLLLYIDGLYDEAIPFLAKIADKVQGAGFILNMALDNFAKKSGEPDVVFKRLDEKLKFFEEKTSATALANRPAKSKFISDIHSRALPPFVTTSSKTVNDVMAGLLEKTVPVNRPV